MTNNREIEQLKRRVEELERRGIRKVEGPFDVYPAWLILGTVALVPVFMIMELNASGGLPILTFIYILSLPIIGIPFKKKR